jgi:hypothetical protein
MAEHFGNSALGKLGPMSCWTIALTERTEMEDAEYKGVFLTEKGGLGFINQGHIARFHKGVVLIGTSESAIEGINVTLLAIGLDGQDQIVFVVEDDYRGKFDISDQRLMYELETLKSFGASVISVKEALARPETIEVLWTVPAQQADPSDPQVLESLRPEIL